MFYKKMFPFIFILSGLLLLNGCSEKKVSMDYIKIPSAVTLKGDIHRQEVDNIMSQLKQMKIDGTKNASQEQGLMSKIAELDEDASIQISDKDFIQKVIGSIAKSLGTTNPKISDISQNKEQFDLIFNYNSMNFDENKTKDGFIPNIPIFADGNTLIPVYNEKSSNELIFIKVKLSDDVMEYIRDYYKNHKNAK